MLAVQDFWPATAVARLRLVVSMEISFRDFEFWVEHHNRGLTVADDCYFAWLQKQIEEGVEVAEVQPGFHPLHLFSADATNAVGWRHVARGAVLLKAERYFKDGKLV